MSLRTAFVKMIAAWIAMWALWTIPLSVIAVLVMPLSDAWASGCGASLIGVWCACRSKWVDRIAERWVTM